MDADVRSSLQPATNHLIKIHYRLIIIIVNVFLVTGRITLLLEIPETLKFLKANQPSTPMVLGCAAVAPSNVAQ